MKDFKHWAIIASITAVFLAGSFNGVMDSLQFHYGQNGWHPQGTETFLGGTEQYWNPAKSWTNKYKDNDVTKGPAFFAANTALVFLTDAWHLAKFIMTKLFYASAILIFFWKTKNPRWWYPVLVFCAFWVVFALGFHSIYTLT